MGLIELKRLTVDSFQPNERRLFLFSELERLISDLQKLKMIGQLWIDGSFLTQKPEPEDIDLTAVFYEQDIKCDDLKRFLLYNLNGDNNYSNYLDA